MAKEHKQEPNVVYFFQFTRWAFGPCQSQPCMRVEAFLRFHKIPHVVNCSSISGPCGRNPWISYNGKVVTDSQLIIDFLTVELKLPPTFLSSEQQGIAMAVERMLDFHVYHFGVRWNWVDNFEIIDKYTPLKIGPAFFTRFVKKVVRGKVIKSLNAGGWGDYSIEEYRLQWVQDVKAIEQILGSKKYLFGDSDEEISRTDLSVFAFLHCHTVMPDQYVYSGLREMLRDGAPLHDYIKRLEQRLYPDIKEVIGRAGCKESERYPAALSSAPSASAPTTY